MPKPHGRRCVHGWESQLARQQTTDQCACSRNNTAFATGLAILPAATAAPDYLIEQSPHVVRHHRSVRLLHTSQQTRSHRSTCQDRILSYTSSNRPNFSESLATLRKAVMLVLRPSSLLRKSRRALPAGPTNEFNKLSLHRAGNLPAVFGLRSIDAAYASCEIIHLTHPAKSQCLDQ